LLEPVAGEFRPALESAAWRLPTRPYLPNAVGRFVREPGPAQFIALLSEQVSAPVLWEESIDFLDDRFTDLVLVEVGPRAVLYNLLGKRWKCEIPRYKTDSQDDLYGSIVALAEELSHGVDRTAVVA
jgi:[acyl-carrier-protein] S-malonyltransferase